MKRYELGRSMVEMLGVLAIIGVLSVTGLYGYSTAMKKHQTNEMIRELNMRANLVAMQLLSGNEPNISDLGNVFLAENSFEFEALKSDANNAGTNEFEIQLTGKITKEMCRQLFLQLGDKSVIKRIHFLGGSTDSSYCDNFNGQSLTSLSFVFNDDMSVAGDISSNVGEFTSTVDCTGTSTRCKDGHTVQKCQNGAWFDISCSWGCNDGVCIETCTDADSGKKGAFQFTNSLGTIRYCMVTKCTNGSWKSENPVAFCKTNTSTACTIASCTTVDTAALNEFNQTFN